MKQLSKAGVSVAQVGAYSVERVGEIYDILIDRVLDQEFFNQLYRYLVDNYGYFMIQSCGSNIVLRLIPIKKSRSFYKKIILLLLTLFTVWLTGYGLSFSFYETIGEIDVQGLIPWSIIYTASFMVALSIHEYGHMLASRKAGVVIDGPYFIPAPPVQLGFIGTLGAVISMKTLPPDRRSLARLGLSGPLFGYLIGVIIGAVGVMLSPLLSWSVVEEMLAKGEVQEIGFTPLTIWLLINLRGVPHGYELIIHPVLFASYVIMLVTFLNLLPIAQLDGGHVVRSYTSLEKYEMIGRAVIMVFALAGLSMSLLGIGLGTYYLSLSLVLLLFKIILGKHPHYGSANQCSVLRDYKYLIIYIVLLIMVMPIPII